MDGQLYIFLSDKAFVGIVVSSVEVFKNECLGVLLGYRTPGRIIIEYVIPFQTAKRKRTNVEPNWKRMLKVEGILPKLVQFRHLGYFHSHSQYGDEKSTARLSNEDRDSIEKGDVEIVVAINEAKRSVSWDQSGQELSGTIGEYNIHIAGYYKRKTDGKIKQYAILCPYVMGFDYTF